MRLNDSDFVRQLQAAENHFLQTLLSTFVLTRRADGVELQVRFGRQTPTIWLRDDKRHVRQSIRGFDTKVEKYQRALDDFLLKGIGSEYVFEDASFPLRYASGGTLPVIRMGTEEYYCLLYREMAPVGWNIANGGCDSSYELMHPFETIERELREELIIVEPARGHRYVFEADEGRPIDHPDFAIAWRLWSARFARLGYPSIDKWQRIALKWLSGPDTVTTHVDGADPCVSAGCFLNINAEDFGIEVDRVAKMNIAEDAVICDGEIIDGKLVNQLVGLFEVRRFNDALAAETKHFTPDFFFYGGERFDGHHVAEKVAECLEGLEDCRSTYDRKVYADTEGKYELCPVTRRIIKRYLLYEMNRPLAASLPRFSAHRVFISFGSEDRMLARQVYDHLFKASGRPPFFSDETLRHPDFGRAIDDALDSASCLIAVGSHVQHLLKDWPQYEWRSFHQDILSKRKKNAQLLSYVDTLDPDELPRPLRYREAIVHTHDSPTVALRQLEALVC